ncbi:MAG: hypothetical protein UT21_C0006G0016 [Candidatus Woesebacteria bacterium GW2011_GWA1_39_11b]|nr:MAG: hypothetical protein UT21_C0006G0016 [Candidatus Woesebacteria bacterium GW2011_GWA1_39_11b]
MKTVSTINGCKHIKCDQYKGCSNIMKWKGRKILIAPCSQSGSEVAAEVKKERPAPSVATNIKPSAIGKTVSAAIKLVDSQPDNLGIRVEVYYPFALLVRFARNEGLDMYLGRVMLPCGNNRVIVLISKNNKK